MRTEWVLAALLPLMVTLQINLGYRIAHINEFVTKMGSAWSSAPMGSHLLEEVTLSNLKYDMHDAKVMIPAVVCMIQDCHIEVETGPL